MAHYAYVIAVHRLKIDAHIGFYLKEREQLQPIELSFRLYFAEEMPCNQDDQAAFFDYAKLSDVLREYIAGKYFNLIEYMGMALFRELRKAVDGQPGGDKAKLWLQLNKIQAPVPNLLGGASFIHSDLPAGSTFIPSVL